MDTGFISLYIFGRNPWCLVACLTAKHTKSHWKKIHTSKTAMGQCFSFNVVVVAYPQTQATKLNAQAT